MPTRKQRKRALKERRHEYETVWVDEEGNELEEPPNDAPMPARDSKAKAPAKKNQAQRNQRSNRATRTPLPPSWRRAAKRALILGAVIFVLFAIVGSKGGKQNYLSALLLAVLYTALFIPFTYYVDRFAYRRWQRRMGEPPTKR